MPEEQLAGSGELDAGVRALHEFHAQLVFECADGLVEPLLRDERALRGLVERPGTGQLDKVPKRVDLHAPSRKMQPYILCFSNSSLFDYPGFDLQFQPPVASTCKRLVNLRVSPCG